MGSDPPLPRSCGEPHAPPGGAVRAIRVLVVDDHALVRTGLRTLLGLVEDIEWVGEASDGSEAVGQVRLTQPDVVLMDLSMPDVDGTAATALIAQDHPGVRVVVLTSCTQQSRLESALAAGAVAVLNKDGDPSTVLTGIRTAFGSGGPPAWPIPGPRVP